MCGIFGVKIKQNNAPQLVLEGLKKLEYRGYDSWGVASLANDKKIMVVKKVGKIGQARISSVFKSGLALGHTRWATHGGVSQENAHPHLDCSGRLALVHNGIIENYLELKNSLGKRHKFVSQTDSEILVHLIEDKLSNYPLTEAVRLSFLQCFGLNAIVLIDTVTGAIVVAKNGSPIVIAQGKGGVFVASDSSTLLKFSKDLTFLEDGEMMQGDGRRTVFFQIKNGKQFTPIIQHVDYDYSESELGDYKYFMLKEIFEQPKVILNSVLTLEDELIKIGNALKHKRIYLLACGSSYHACLFAKYFLKIIAKIHCEVVYAHENVFLENLDDNCAAIAISQSGETIDMVESVKKLIEQKVEVIAVTNVIGSTLYRLCGQRVVLPAGPEIGVAATKSFMAQVVFFCLLGYMLKNSLQRGKEKLNRLSGAIDNLLFEKNRIKQIARKLKDQNTFFILGRSFCYPLALECALKIKEVTYIHAEGIAGGELKHGVIALIEKGMPCIVLAENNEHFLEMISNAKEIKARGAVVIGLSPIGNEVFDFWFPVSDLSELTSIQHVVICQIIAYFLAIAKNLDPDKPRNLAKSVVVK